MQIRDWLSWVGECQEAKWGASQTGELSERTYEEGVMGPNLLQAGRERGLVWGDEGEKWGSREMGAL